MMKRVMKNLNLIDKIVNVMSDGKTLPTLFLFSCLAIACSVCFIMLQGVYSTYIWWTATAEGQLTAATNTEELYRNCWWGILTVMNNIVSISLVIRVVFNRFQQLDAMECSEYPAIPSAGVLAKTCSSLYFIAAIWSLAGNNLQLLLKRPLVTLSGIWQDLFPYHKIKDFSDGQGDFIFSWKAFGSFNIEMISYFLVITIALNFISQFILSYYSYIIEAKISLKEECNKGSHVSRDVKRNLPQ